MSIASTPDRKQPAALHEERAAGSVGGGRRRRRLTLATFWSEPLGYPQAVLTVLSALAIGVWFHFRVGYDAPLDAGLALPFALAFLAAAGLAGRLGRERRVVRWVSGVPFAVCSIAAVAGISVVGGVVPSAALEARWGVESAFTSWPFRMALALMLLNLVCVTARRCWPLTAQNAWFTLCHLGLIVAVLGGWLGSAGLEQATLTLYQGKPERVAQRLDGTALPLPFEMTLRDFELEQFPPVFGIGEIDPAAMTGIRFQPGNRLAAAGMRERIQDIEIEVKRFLPRGALVGDTWHATALETCAPAALIAAHDQSGHKIAEGWVSSGSIDTPRLALTLSETRAVMMAPPRPREFRSSVLVERDGTQELHDIRMNKAATFGSIRVYQTSYDEALGPASKFSVLTVVEDRYVRLVYAGMLMVLLSVFWMLGSGFRSPGPVSGAEVS